VRPFPHGRRYRQPRAARQPPGPYRPLGRDRCTIYLNFLDSKTLRKCSETRGTVSSHNLRLARWITLYHVDWKRVHLMASKNFVPMAVRDGLHPPAGDLRIPPTSSLTTERRWQGGTERGVQPCYLVTLLSTAIVARRRWRVAHSLKS
jgi:hypothetical protein